MNLCLTHTSLSLSLSLSLLHPPPQGNSFAAASLAEARLSQAKRCVPPAQCVGSVLRSCAATCVGCSVSSIDCVAKLASCILSRHAHCLDPPTRTSTEERTHATTTCTSPSIPITHSNYTHSKYTRDHTPINTHTHSHSSHPIRPMHFSMNPFSSLPKQQVPHADRNPRRGGGHGWWDGGNVAVVDGI